MALAVVVGFLFDFLELHAVIRLLKHGVELAHGVIHHLVLHQGRSRDCLRVSLRTAARLQVLVIHRAHIDH